MIQHRQVEAFRAVMLTGAMTAAAEMMHVTQPAVSRLIRDLEEELGFPLFLRRRGNVTAPTAQAHSLFAEVERSFIGLRGLQDFAQDLKAGRGGSLRVAAMPAVASGFLPRFVARFCRERPRVDVFLDGLPSHMIREGVISGRLDIGVTAAPLKTATLATVPLDDHAVVAIPAGHRLERSAAVEAGDLDGEALVLLSKFSHELRHPIGLALQSAAPGKVIETPLSTIACALASEGAGLAIVDPFSASEFVGKGVALRPFRPATVIGTAVISSSERGFSILAQEFHDAFLAHARDFLARADYLRTPG